jgi:GTP diphosphokinase / guanosine-3',5'-bis(diphosphate) 3'-diphosphatase
MKEVSRDDLSLASEQLWDDLKIKITYLPNQDQKLIELAFTQMVIAHGTMRRKSGEFYIIHPVEACKILADLKMDTSTLVAALLHDVPEDTEVSLEDLSKDFSGEIIFLIEGVTKLGQVKYQGEERYAENLRKMFVAMSKDLRVILIKLADRLHNLRTLQYVKPEKQTRIALESLDIYAPIAERLGISILQTEIEDTAFQYIYPEVYKQFVDNSALEIEKRNLFMKRLVGKTENILNKENLNFIDIYGRTKKYYSLFKKLQEKDKTLDQVYDLVALRIIVDSIDDCYYTLSVLQRYFLVDNRRIKDYIARPKLNGYQSIHLTVTDEELQVTFEFQIRTKQMHEFAEYGVAAHFIYKNMRKSSSGSKPAFLPNENLKWIKELIDLGKEKMSPEEYLQNVKLDLFQNRIFVMTPKKDAIDLPKGSTPLDFAFKIHAKIGETALMAKINGQIAKLSEELKNGDEIEIITDKRQKPNVGWLDWVKTRQARQHIKATLKKQ